MVLLAAGKQPAGFQMHQQYVGMPGFLSPETVSQHNAIPCPAPERQRLQAPGTVKRLFNEEFSQAHDFVSEESFISWFWKRKGKAKGIKGQWKIQNRRYTGKFSKRYGPGRRLEPTQQQQREL